MPSLSMLLIFLILMDQSFQAYYALFREMMLLVGKKKDILPKSVKDGKVTQWLTERPREEGMRPVDVMLTSAQNHHAIKELIQRIEKTP